MGGGGLTVIMVLPIDGLRCYGSFELFMRNDSGGGGTNVEPALWNRLWSMYSTFVREKFVAA